MHRPAFNCDVLVTGEYFCDLIYAGLPEAPRLGAEYYARDLTVLPGGTYNIALALSMGVALRGARTVLEGRKVNAPELVHALEAYDAQSNIGAAILARMSQRHYQVHQKGAWALAGIALSRA